VNSLKTYIFKTNPEGDIVTEVLLELAQFRRSFEPLLDVSDARVLVHVGYTRPYPLVLESFFAERGTGIFFTEAARAVYLSLLQYPLPPITNIGSERLFRLVTAPEVDPPDGRESMEESGTGSVVKGSAITNTSNMLVERSQTPSLEFEWFLHLPADSLVAGRNAIEKGIIDDFSYVNLEHQLSPLDRIRLARARFNFITKNAKFVNASDFVARLPPWWSRKDVRALDTSVRTLNVLRRCGISVIYDFRMLSDDALFQIPGCGMKVISEIRSSLERISIAEEDLMLVTPLVTQGSNTDSDQLLVDRAEDSNAPDPHVDEINQITDQNLRETFMKLFDSLDSKQRIILEGRVGLYGEPKTLQEVAVHMSITRERVRQIERQGWEDLEPKYGILGLIQTRIDEVRKGLSVPLTPQRLESYDSWFVGFFDFRRTLTYLLGVDSACKYKVHAYRSSTDMYHIIAEGREDFIDDAMKSILAYAREKLRQHPREKEFLERIHLLVGVSSPELQGFLYSELKKRVSFARDAEGEYLSSVGRGLEAQLRTILAESDEPLHVVEIKDRFGKIYGISHEEGYIRNTCSAGFLLYGPSTFGLDRHLGLSSEQSKAITEVVKGEIERGDLRRQWHAHELVDVVQEAIPDISNQIDKYKIGIVLSKSTEFCDLGRLVFSLQTQDGTHLKKRIDFYDFVEAVLETSAGPLTTAEILDSISRQRGLNEFTQILPLGRVVSVGNALWALYDQHLGLSKHDLNAIVSKAIEIFEEKNKGLTVSEFSQLIKDREQIGSYRYDGAFVLSLCFKFKKIRKMEEFHYPTNWEGCRRATLKTVFFDISNQIPSKGLTMREILQRASDIRGVEVSKDGVHKYLRENGLYFDTNSATWKKEKQLYDRK
jgi:hypothetical protein